MVYLHTRTNKKSRTKEADVQTEQGENGMEPARQVETPVQIELQTLDPHRRRGDMQTGSHSSAHPQGKAEDDIEEESKRLVGEEGIIMWIIILLLDGDYLSCVWTTWKGNYVFDKELNIIFCKADGNAYNLSDLQRTFREFICISQIFGYIGIAFLGFVIIVSVGIYDRCQGGIQEFKLFNAFMFILFVNIIEYALGYAVISLLSILIIVVGLYDCCCVRRHPETQKALQGEGQQLKPLVPVPNLPPSEGSGQKEENS
ncbi:hypothetical protein E1301_Tti012830 [Triplophysa tibetana]|uniref:Uncharacterized protein n=1 Tax=Triplophysa tibetana TaxID=1572043 RepID=A0A5A9NSR8_9TELE|nr:hypothetical protein E1301_Tti012830 [Triplophysa tibetana]